jgi:hypothetical protein
MPPKCEIENWTLLLRKSETRLRKVGQRKVNADSPVMPGKQEGWEIFHFDGKRMLWELEFIDWRVGGPGSSRGSGLGIREVGRGG